MSTRKMRWITVGALCAAASLSAAAFDLKKLPGMPAAPANTATTQTTGGADALLMQEKVIRKYQEASQQIVTAQHELALAFDLKDQAAILGAQAQAMQSGPTWSKDDIKKQNTLSADANTAIQQKLDEGAQLTEEGKKHYINSLAPFASGILLTKGLPPELQSFSSAAQTQLSNASMLEKMNVGSKLSAGLFLVKELPGHTVRLLGSFRNIVAFAKKNEIPVPQDATALLSSASPVLSGNQS